MTILVADDLPVIRTGLCSIISSLSFDGKVLEAENETQVLSMAAESPIDLFLFDFRMKALDGFSAAQFLLSKNPKTKILIFSMYTEAEQVRNLILIGVHGFVVKSEKAYVIENAIVTILRGGQFFSQAIEKIVKEVNQGVVKNSGIVEFSDSEKDLVRLLASGCTTRAIASNLNLSYKTIETYRYRLLKKAKVSNTAGLVNYFYRLGYI